MQHEDIVTPVQQGRGPHASGFHSKPGRRKAYPDRENGEADQAVPQGRVAQPDVRINDQGIVPGSPDQAGNKCGLGKAGELHHFGNQETAPGDLFQDGRKGAVENQSPKDDDKVGWELAVVFAPTGQPYQAVPDQTVNDRYRQPQEQIPTFVQPPAHRAQAALEDQVGDDCCQSGRQHEQARSFGSPPSDGPGPDDRDVSQGAEDNGQNQENDDLAQGFLF